MTKLGKRLLSVLMTLVLLLSLAPAAMADGTSLQVKFTGLYATAEGAYASIPLSGLFEVYQDDALLGTLEVTTEGENTMALTSGSSVRLVPVMEAIPAEIPLSEYGYSVSIAEGRLNIAPLTVYANAGLFAVQADGAASFELLNEDGVALQFETDKAGKYALDVALPAGEYTLRMTAAEGGLMEDQNIELPVYTGEESILLIDAKLPVPEATATPVPTEAPTATPVPTEAPTATPVPTEAPTATPVPAPTATTVPTTGTISIHIEGTETKVPYGVWVSNDKLRKGKVSASQPMSEPDLEAGGYILVLSLPEGLVITELNGESLVHRGTYRWRVTLSAMEESLHHVTLSETGSVTIPFEDVAATSVTLAGPRETVELSAGEDGSFSGSALLPDTYTVTAVLPEGQYSFDSDRWTLAPSGEDGWIATASVTVSIGGTAELPAISKSRLGMVSGVVKDADGKAIKGVNVAIYDAKGQIAAEATTDKKGAWQVTELPYGDYTAQYTYEKSALPASSFSVNAGNWQPELSVNAVKAAQITVRAYMDENNNGSLGKGEGGAKGVEIALLASDGTPVAIGQTAKDGYVTLYAPAGKYTLRATVPADYGFAKKGEGMNLTNSILDESTALTQCSTTLTLSADKVLEVGVGVQPMATVTGTVWNDLNADGRWQKDEPGIPGVRVTITGGRGAETVEAFTDENGFYALHQLKKGNYELVCYVPDDYVFTVKAKKGDVEEISRMTTEADRAGTDNFALERGEVHDNHNIGMMEGAIIEGVCFLDANFNGQYDVGEKPLAGVEMRLARQSNNVLLQQTTSAADGSYHFVGQRGSTFTIRANLPSGYVFSVVGMGDNGNRFAPNGNKTERRLTDVTLENGGYMQVMLGAVTFGSISGRVYFDSNFSAKWESGEPVGEGFLVTLYDADGEKVVSKRSDKNGNFSFTDLNPGEYTLRMKPEAGYAFTALGTGNVMQTLTDGTGESRKIILEMGEDVKNASAGMIVPATVSGVVFADKNDNGKQDEGEKGFSGVTVRLMSESGEVSSLKVDASGAFKFPSVLPGSYYLKYELPENAVFAPVVKGGNACEGENGVSTTKTFKLAAGDAYTASLCGAVQLSDISGYFFGDANGSGTMDDDENFMSGVTIKLTPTRKELKEISVVTGEDGAFEMRSLRPDTYTLTVVCPEGSVLTRMHEASLGLAHGLNTQSVNFKLAMGTQLHDQHLGCVLPSVWTGVAYLDENYDGIRSANESPAAGETIVLRDANTGEDVSSVKTDAAGNFRIDGIAPGEYELVYVLGEGNLTPKGGDNHLHLNGDVMTTGPVTIAQNEERSGTVVAVARTTEIGGLVWLEQFDGVTPVSRVKVKLMDETGMVLDEVTTGEDGKYLFKGLMPGEYTLDVTISHSYVIVESSDPHLAEAGLISVIDEADGLHGVSGTINLRMAKHQHAMNVGTVLPGRLGDKVWLDLNENGLQDGEEGGIPGVTIELLRGDRVMGTTVSDQYGYYVFEDLYPTEYTLRVTWPAEVMPTKMRTEIAQISSILQADGTTLPVTVESNKANYAADLGFILIDKDKLPAGYGEGETQIWKKTK